MTNPSLDIPVRAPSATTADDTVLPFEISTLDLRGRVVRLGPAVDDILARHDYPKPVAQLLGEAIALTVLLGSALKIEGRQRGRAYIERVVKTFKEVLAALDEGRPLPVDALRGLTEGQSTTTGAYKKTWR